MFTRKSEKYIPKMLLGTHIGHPPLYKKEKRREGEEKKKDKREGGERREEREKEISSC